MVWRNCYKTIFRNKELLATAFTSGLNIALFLLVMNLLSVNLAIFDASFMLVPIAYLLVCMVIFNFPFRKLYARVQRKNLRKTSFYKILTGMVLIIFSFILLLYTRNQMLWPASLPVMISALDIVLKEVEIKRRELHLLAVASFSYAVFYIFEQTVPGLWYSIQSFSLWFSSVFGSLIGRSMLLGPSISGLWIVIIFFIFSCCIFVLSRLKKRYFILNLAGLAICWLVYMFISDLIGFKSKIDIVNGHYLLFIFCLVPTFLYLLKSKLKDESLGIFSFKDLKLGRVVRNGSVWALVLLLLSGVVLTVFPGAGSIDTGCVKRNVLFYGQNMLGSWDVPEYSYERYGWNASGVFGLLPYYLNNSGYNVEIVVNDRSEFLNGTFPVNENAVRYVNLTDYTTIIESSRITRNILRDVDVFVVIDLNEFFSADELKVIWDFVENGGSLLVLGEHTDMGGVRQPLNDLLKPVGISYRFDSALYQNIEGHWMRNYHLMYHPMTYRIDSSDELQIHVGASLDINAGSFPLLIGQYDISDEGNRSNTMGDYLGDYVYNKGEQIGDIVLVAGAYYGAGKVLVFGDTSPFQNSLLSYSFPFVDSVFLWLDSPSTATMEYIQIIVSLLLLVEAIVLYIRFRKTKIRFVLFPLVLCISLIISAIINPMIIGKEEIEGNLVYIDVSHVERFNRDLLSSDDSLSGFMMNLMRNNYLPLILRDFSKDKIKNSEIVVFNAPTKAFSGYEVDAIKQYIHDGGLVILSTGYQDKDASMPLLREFGLDIYNIPLGPVPYLFVENKKYQTEPVFVDSWPVDIGDSKDTEIFYSVNISNKTYVLMTFTKYGDGGLLFIGDSEFLTNKNIETLYISQRYSYCPGNIQFLRNILDEIKKRGVL